MSRPRAERLEAAAEGLEAEIALLVLQADVYLRAAGMLREQQRALRVTADLEIAAQQGPMRAIADVLPAERRETA